MTSTPFTAQTDPRQMDTWEAHALIREYLASLNEPTLFDGDDPVAALIDDPMAALIKEHGAPLAEEPFDLSFATSGGIQVTFVVLANSLDDALGALVTLPTFRRWYHFRSRGLGESVTFQADGAQDCDRVLDLRKEQRAHLDAATSALLDTVSPEGEDLEADLRHAVRAWFAAHARPLPETVTFRAQRRTAKRCHCRDGFHKNSGCVWPQLDATLHYPDATSKLTDEFDRTHIAAVLAEINQDGPVDDQGLTIRLLPTDKTSFTPGTEHPFAISDYARETVLVLGDGWGAESGYLGVYGLIWGPDVPTLRLGVDNSDSLVICTQDGSDPVSHIVELPWGAPPTPQALRDVAERIAAIIRTVYCG